MAKVRKTKLKHSRCRICGKLVTNCEEYSWPVIFEETEGAKCCNVCYLTYISNLQKIYQTIYELQFLSYADLIIFLNDTKLETDKLLLAMMDTMKAINEKTVKEL